MSNINSTISTILNSYYGIGTTSGGVSSSADKTTTAKSSTATVTAPKNDTRTMVGKYLSSVTPETADAKKIFEKLSIDVGSDGKSIKKEQLDSFIKDAKSGAVEVSDKELSALNDLQKNWTKIADGADNITYAGVRTAGFRDTLTSMAPDKATETDYAQQFADDTADAYSKVVVAALGGTTDEKDKTSSLSKLLNTLLKGTTDENDDTNANLIGTLTNLIATSKVNSTVEYEA